MISDARSKSGDGAEGKEAEKPLLPEHMWVQRVIDASQVGKLGYVWMPKDQVVPNDECVLRVSLRRDYERSEMSERRRKARRARHHRRAHG